MYLIQYARDWATAPCPARAYPALTHNGTRHLARGAAVPCS